MQAEDSTTETRGARHRMRLVAVLGAAALAIPGGVAIGSAFAADGGGSAPAAQQAPGAGGFAPVQDEERPAPGEDRDCPEKDGGRSGSGSDSGTGTAPTAL